jgi:hypothetical protein
VIEPEEWMTETGREAGTDGAEGVGKYRRRRTRQHQPRHYRYRAFMSHGRLLHEIVKNCFVYVAAAAEACAVMIGKPEDEAPDCLARNGAGWRCVSVTSDCLSR